MSKRRCFDCNEEVFYSDPSDGEDGPTKLEDIQCLECGRITCEDCAERGLCYWCANGAGNLVQGAR